MLKKKTIFFELYSSHLIIYPLFNQSIKALFQHLNHGMSSNHFNIIIINETEKEDALSIHKALKKNYIRTCVKYTDLAITKLHCNSLLMHAVDDLDHFT